jgi:hypothetical protein
LAKQEFAARIINTELKVDRLPGGTAGLVVEVGEFAVGLGERGSVVGVLALEICGGDPCIRGACVDYEGEARGGDGHISDVDASADIDEVFLDFCDWVCLPARKSSFGQYFSAVTV